MSLESDYKNYPLHRGNIYLLLPKGLTRSRQLADLQLYRNLLSMTPFNSMTTRCSCTWKQKPSTLHSDFTLPAWQHHKRDFRNQRHFTSSSQSSSFMLWCIANFQNFSTSKGKRNKSITVLEFVPRINPELFANTFLRTLRRVPQRSNQSPSNPPGTPVQKVTAFFFQFAEFLNLLSKFHVGSNFCGAKLCIGLK